MSDRDRRIRGPNFSPEEELELVQNVYIYRHIIESRELDSATRGRKENAWHKVLETFNSKFPPRKLERIRSKYDNLKTMAKKYRALKLRQARISGGGDCSFLRPNPLLDIVLEIMEIKANGALDISPQPTEHRNSDELLLPLKIKQEIEDTDESDGNQTESHYSTLIDPLEQSNCDTSQITIEPIIEQQSLRPPSHHNVVNRSLTPSVKNELKRKNSHSLTIKPIETDNCFQIEAEYIKKKIKALEKEQEERVTRLKMEQEQHEMKMKILKLEVSIKEQELLRLKKNL